MQETSEIKDIMLQIKGTQTSGPAQDSIELITHGTLRRSPDGFEIDYAESAENGLEDMFTKISVESQKRVTITRTGKYGSQLILEKGKRHLNHYDMGFGQFVMGVSTANIDNRLTMDGGELSVTYTLEMNHALMSRNRFHITVKDIHAAEQSESIDH